jgi:hypothetical protein
LTLSETEGTILRDVGKALLCSLSVQWAIVQRRGLPVTGPRQRRDLAVLRHSAAMQLLQNGVDRTVIALWLGHESVESTQMYMHADIQLKQQAIEDPASSGLIKTKSTGRCAARLSGRDSHYTDIGSCKSTRRGSGIKRGNNSEVGIMRLLMT